MDGIDTGAFLLYLQNKEGKRVCLSNTRCPPYRKPRLPFAGKSPTVHHLLKPLKVAHTFLVKAIMELAYNPPEGFYGFQELYNIERTTDYWDERPEIGDKYLCSDMLHPFLVSGFCLNAGNHEHLSFSFDLSPFYADYPEYKGYKKNNLTLDMFQRFIQAASFYNEYAQELFKKGFIVIPHEFIETIRTPNDILEALIAVGSIRQI